MTKTSRVPSFEAIQQAMNPDGTYTPFDVAKSVRKEEKYTAQQMSTMAKQGVLMKLPNGRYQNPQLRLSK